MLPHSLILVRASHVPRPHPALNSIAGSTEEWWKTGQHPGNQAK